MARRPQTESGRRASIILATGLVAAAGIALGLLAGSLPDEPDPGVVYIIWGIVPVLVIIIIGGFLLGFAAQPDDFDSGSGGEDDSGPTDAGVPPAGVPDAGPG